jgi:hypothetical protein
VAENEHAVFGSEKFPRREIDRFLMLCDALEEFLDLGRPSPASEQRIILAAAVDVPIDVGCQGLDDGGDVASAKGGIEALNENDVGVLIARSGCFDTGMYERGCPVVARPTLFFRRGALSAGSG